MTFDAYRSSIQRVQQFTPADAEMIHFNCVNNPADIVDQTRHVLLVNNFIKNIIYHISSEKQKSVKITLPAFEVLTTKIACIRVDSVFGRLLNTRALQGAQLRKS